MPTPHPLRRGEGDVGGRYSDPAAVSGSDTTVWVVSYEPADTCLALRRMRDRRVLGLSLSA
jgi:hypothetical protein